MCGHRFYISSVRADLYSKRQLWQLGDAHYIPCRWWYRFCCSRNKL